MVAKRKVGRRPRLSAEQVKKIREEYSNNPRSTLEYLADKYEVSRHCINSIIRNKTHHDKDYISPKRSGGGSKRGVFLPEHLLEAKDLLTPAPTTAHRARGQNHVINRFK